MELKKGMKVKMKELSDFKRCSMLRFYSYINKEEGDFTVIADRLRYLGRVCTVDEIITSPKGKTSFRILEDTGRYEWKDWMVSEIVDEKIRKKETVEKEIKEFIDKIYELEKELINMSKFMVGNLVVIKNADNYYDTYDEWVLHYAPTFAVNFAYKGIPETYTYYAIVAKGRHLENGRMLYLIQNVVNDACYIFEEDNLELA